MRKRDVENGVTGGVSFTGLLTLAFIILKLIGIINWHWVWVLSPIWIQIAIVLVVAFIGIIIEIIRS